MLHGIGDKQYKRFSATAMGCLQESGARQELQYLLFTLEAVVLGDFLLWLLLTTARSWWLGMCSH